MNNNNNVLMIGMNYYGDLGLNHSKNVKQLTLFKHSNTNKATRTSYIYSGHEYSIYYHDKQYFVAVPKSTKIMRLTPINYFTKHNIQIKKVCVNVNGYATFWISDKNKCYGNGRNIDSQLGIGDNNDRFEPEPISQLNDYNHILDIQSVYNYSIALCSPYNQTAIMIVTNWYRNIKIKKHKIIPHELINLIVIFFQSKRIYSTGFSKSGGNAQNQKHNQFGIKKWNEIEILNDKNIISIETGFRHSLFLEVNGILWCCGNNYYGQIGLGHNKNSHWPLQNKYFIDNNIKISAIKCGAYHNLIIDYNGNVYSFGANDYGQLGDGTKQNKNTPELITYFKGYKIDYIDCGSFHSYSKSVDGKHFLFGSNNNNECIKYDNNNSVILPHCINQIVKENCDGNIIITSVSLGHYNTKIIVSHQ